MRRRINPKRVAESNPGVDVSRLKKGLQALEELRKLGVESEGYNIITPFNGNPKAKRCKARRNKGRQAQQ